MNWAALLSTSLSVHQDSCCCCSVAFSSSNLIQHVQHGGSESPGGVGAERFHVMRPEEPNSVTHGGGRRPRLDRTAKFAPLLIPTYCSCWHLWKDWVLQYKDRFTNQLFSSVVIQNHIRSHVFCLSFHWQTNTFWAHCNLTFLNLNFHSLTNLSHLSLDVDNSS